MPCALFAKSFTQILFTPFLWQFGVCLGSYHDDSVSINYSSLAISLLLIVIPCACGVFLRFKNTTRKIRDKFLWEWCEVLGSAIGLLFIVVILIISFATNAHILDSGADVWIPALLIEPLGCGFGYLLAKLGRLDRTSRRAVSLETGVQNYTFVIAVISLTWKDDCDSQEAALVFPYVQVSMSNSCLWMLGLLWICTEFNSTLNMISCDFGGVLLWLAFALVFPYVARRTLVVGFVSRSCALHSKCWCTDTTHHQQYESIAIIMLLSMGWFPIPSPYFFDEYRFHGIRFMLVFSRYIATIAYGINSIWICGVYR